MVCRRETGPDTHAMAMTMVAVVMVTMFMMMTSMVAAVVTVMMCLVVRHIITVCSRSQPFIALYRR